jgi:N-acetylated-alpha-linked acidic dipeptidase
VRIGITAALAIVALACIAVWQRPVRVPFGFTRGTAAAEAAVERRFLALPSAENIRDEHRIFTAAPHMAGTVRDHELMERIRDRFASYGLEDVEVTTHEVLLPWPEVVTVEMVSPAHWRASMREEPIAEDPDTQIPPGQAGLPFHAYSASGDVTAPLVVAGSGNPSDYEALSRRGVDVRGKIALVKYSVPYSYRGFKALTAQERGAAGILIYSDPADDGAG